MNILEEKIKYIPLEGFFELDVVDATTREVIDHYEEKNIIVLDAKEAIIYAISQSPNGHINKIKVGEDIGNVVNIIGSPNITFVDNAPSADTIVRDTGSWIDDGYIEQMTLTVTNTTSNNTTYTVDTVTATTITLIGGDSVVPEGPIPGVVITGTPSNNNPRPPVETYNEGTMSIVYDSPSALTIGYGSATSVTFNATIIGTDVMALYPTETTKIITSAALHTGNTKVFAYKRFPQKSVSSLVDIVINWTIKY